MSFNDSSLSVCKLPTSTVDMDISTYTLNMLQNVVNEKEFPIPNPLHNSTVLPTHCRSGAEMKY